MKTLYFDCFAGISGDMTLGALVDLGVPFEFLQKELSKLGLDDFEVSFRRVSRAAIDCAKVDVHLANQTHASPADHSHHPHEQLHGPSEHPHRPSESAHSPQVHSHHPHDHDHSHPEHVHWPNEHSHGPLEHQHSSHKHAHPPSENAHGETEHTHSPHEHHHHRGLREITDLITRSGLSKLVRERSIRIFRKLAEAEGKVHGISPDAVHFHEVGATDAIVDIVGACIGFEFLGIQRFIASPVRVGYGLVKCAHGNYPIPAPGTAELLKGIPFYAGDLASEFTTPTGAAILATLCDEFTRSPNLAVERIGYGAGNRDFPSFPNAVRLLLGNAPSETGSSRWSTDTVSVIEATVDDQTAEELGFALERWMEAGALDVFFTPVQMKKGRPGTLVTLLCRTEDENRFYEALFRDTTTLGIRTSRSERRILARTVVQVETGFGPLRVKVAEGFGSSKIHPEYEDCREAARRTGLSLSEIRAAAVRAYEKQHSGTAE